MGQYSCYICGTEFKRAPSLARSEHAFCCRACYTAYRKQMGNLLSPRQEKVKKTCPTCQIVFEVNQGEADRRIFCSKRCKGLAARGKEVICETCGTSFPHRPGRVSRFCSRKCTAEGKKQGVNKICKSCGKSFYVSISLSSSRFCSSKCANTWQGRAKIEHSCIVCSKSFKTSPSGKGRPYCSMTCRNSDPHFHERLLEMNRQQQLGKQTVPERIGYSLLDELKVEYIPQHLIAEKFCVDAFLPAHKLVVQFDGDYWHGHPEKFPTLDKRQAKRVKLDKSQDAYMKKLGYRVVRIWETTLKKEVEVARSLISDNLLV